MRKLLVVIDYQNDFVDGSLGFSGAEKLEEKLVNKIKENEIYGNDIIYTLDTHENDYLQTQEGKKLPVEHCIKKTKGWELYGEVCTALKGKKCFEKNTFGSDKLFDYLKENYYDKIEIVGLVSNICVISNAIIAKTASPNSEIIVDSSCTASFDNELNSKTLDVMEGLQITVINR